MGDQQHEAAEAQGYGHQLVGQGGALGLSFGFAAQRLVDKAADARHGGFCPYPFHRDDEPSFFNDRTGNDRIAGADVYGHGFSGNGALVYGGFALGYHAVDGDEFARAADGLVPQLHFFHGQLLFHSVAHYPDAVATGTHQAFQKCGRALFALAFQILPQGQHGGDGAGSEVVAPQQGQAYGRSVKSLHSNAAGNKTFYAFDDVPDGHAPAQGCRGRGGQGLGNEREQGFGRHRCTAHRLLGVVVRGEGLLRHVFEVEGDFFPCGRLTIVRDHQAAPGGVDARFGHAAQRFQQRLKVDGVKGGVGQQGRLQPHSPGQGVGHPKVAHPCPRLWKSPGLLHALRPFMWALFWYSVTCQ